MAQVDSDLFLKYEFVDEYLVGKQSARERGLAGKPGRHPTAQLAWHPTEAAGPDVTNGPSNA